MMLHYIIRVRYLANWIFDEGGKSWWYQLRKEEKFKIGAKFEPKIIMEISHIRKITAFCIFFNIISGKYMPRDMWCMHVVDTMLDK